MTDQELMNLLVLQQENLALKHAMVTEKIKALKAKMAAEKEDDTGD